MTTSDGTGRKVQYLRPNSAKEYICLHTSKIDACRFVIMATVDVFFMRASFDERVTAFARWFKSGKHWGERRDPAGERHVSLFSKVVPYFHTP